MATDGHILIFLCFCLTELIERLKLIMDCSDKVETKNTQTNMPRSSEYNYTNHKKWTGHKKASKEYTREQIEAVQLLSNCKNYYQVLNVDQDASESQLKTQYRKLALQLHPDKNNAPGASEAFKVLKNAFLTLTDPIKRKIYDQQSLKGQHSGHSFCTNEPHFERSNLFDDNLSSEELLNMFSTADNFYMRKQWESFRSNSTYHSDVNTYSVLLQILPVMVLVFISLLGSLFINDPIYSLTKTS
jgi:hypothetical protein